MSENYRNKTVYVCMHYAMTVRCDWRIAQREAHSPDCYISNFRVTSAEHDTLQFCMDSTVVDSSVAVCIEVGFWCVEQHHAWSEHMIWTSTSCQHCWYWSKYYKKRRTRRNSKGNPGLCEVKFALQQFVKNWLLRCFFRQRILKITSGGQSNFTFHKA